MSNVIETASRTIVHTQAQRRRRHKPTAATKPNRPRTKRIMTESDNSSGCIDLPFRKNSPVGLSVARLTRKRKPAVLKTKRAMITRSPKGVLCRFGGVGGGGWVKVFG